MDGGKSYETERLLGEYLLFHYGKPEKFCRIRSVLLGHWTLPCEWVTECLDLATLAPFGRALDLGCAVGRSSFELHGIAKKWLASTIPASFITRLINCGYMVPCHTCVPTKVS